MTESTKTAKVPKVKAPACSVKIWRPRGSWGDWGMCSKPGTVERDGVRFCTIHNPDAKPIKEAKEAATTARSEAWLDARKAHHSAVIALAKHAVESKGWVDTVTVVDLTEAVRTAATAYREAATALREAGEDPRAFHRDVARYYISPDAITGATDDR